MRIDRCNNIGDFRSMARRRLPGPIFHYIDGAADDEVTYRRNTEAYERSDLVPNVLAGVESIDMSITVMGQKIDMPLFCSRPRLTLKSLLSFAMHPRWAANYFIHEKFDLPTAHKKIITTSQNISFSSLPFALTMECSVQTSLRGRAHADDAA